MSALLTTTMSVMKEVVELVCGSAGCRTGSRSSSAARRSRTQFAREIGADAYGFDAANAVERIRMLARTSV